MVMKQFPQEAARIAEAVITAGVSEIAVKHL
jgi:hypothetical protein